MSSSALCRFRESREGVIFLSLACGEEDIASSTIVLGISVNVSLAGSYAIDDLRRAGAELCTGDCGSIVTNTLTSRFPESHLTCASLAIRYTRDFSTYSNPQFCLTSI